MSKGPSAYQGLSRPCTWLPQGQPLICFQQSQYFFCLIHLALEAMCTFMDMFASLRLKIVFFVLFDFLLGRKSQGKTLTTKYSLSCEGDLSLSFFCTFFKLMQSHQMFVLTLFFFFSVWKKKKGNKLLVSSVSCLVSLCGILIYCKSYGNEILTSTQDQKWVLKMCYNRVDF